MKSETLLLLVTRPNYGFYPRSERKAIQTTLWFPLCSRAITKFIGLILEISVGPACGLAKTRETPHI